MAKPRVTFNEAKDILSLIGKKLTRAAWFAWSAQQREKAITFAGAAHFRASDNHVAVPPMPEWVKELKDFSLEYDVLLHRVPRVHSVPNRPRLGIGYSGYQTHCGRTVHPRQTSGNPDEVTCRSCRGSNG
jgi:hypothetical protein